MTRDWTPERAGVVASGLGVRLGPEHWRVIAGARELSATAHEVPSLERLAEHLGMASEQLAALFPPPIQRSLWAIAGVGIAR